MLEPSHRRTSFRARRFATHREAFTDRQDSRNAFLGALNRAQDPDEYRVLMFWGAGGQGKTALHQHFQDLLDERIRKQTLVPGAEKLGYACLDFEPPRARTPDQGLLSLRLQLQQQLGAPFPAFDVAFARHFALTRPGANLKDHHPELFQEGSEVLQDVVGVTVDVLSEIPGLSLAYKYLDRWGRRARTWWQRRGLEALQGLDDLKAHELAQELPKYFGADLYDALLPPEDARAGPRPRAVILLDTYEALWRDYPASSGQAALRRVDQWVRRLVAETPGVVHVYCGRERLRWDELDDAYRDVVEHHLLEGFSDADADALLRQVPIDDPAIRECIVGSAEGLPFYLDIQVGIFERLTNRGTTPTAAHFGGFQGEIVPRFVDHLDRFDEYALKALSAARSFDLEIFRLLKEACFPGSPVTFDDATAHSFMTPEPGGRFTMHALMREHLQTLLRDDDDYAATHEVLFAHYARAARIEDLRAITPEQEDALVEAAFHKVACDPEGFGPWLRERAVPYTKAAKYDLLEPLYREALTTTAGDRLAYADQLEGLAGVLHLTGHSGEAEVLLREALAIVRGELGDRHPSYAKTLDQLAMVLWELGRFDEAEPRYREALEISSATIGEQHPEYAIRLNGLAVLLWAMGRYDEAEPLYRRALEIDRAASGTDPPDYAIHLNNLASLLEDLGRYDEAEPLLRQALEISSATIGEQHPNYLSTLNNLAVLLQAMKRLEEAEPLYRQVLESGRMAFGERHPNYANILNNVGGMMRDMKRFEEAEPLLRQALEIDRATIGEHHSVHARHLDNLAKLMLVTGRLEESERLYRQAVAIDRESLGEHHPEYGNHLSGLAILLLEAGRYDEAEPLLRQALELLRGTLGEDHDDTKRTLRALETLRGRMDSDAVRDR